MKTKIKNARKTVADAFLTDVKDAIEMIAEAGGLIFDAPEAASPIRALYRIAEYSQE